MFACALAVTSCQDYDLGLTVEEIAYKKNFEKAFGKIDPNQDFNLATRATVTVSTVTKSNVKIYTRKSDKYTIVGDYQNVCGEKELGIDVVEGTKDLLVVCGNQSAITTVGGTVSFDASTRTIVDGIGNGSESSLVTITKITTPVTIGGTTYNQYKYFDESNYTKFTELLPENDCTNYNKVTHDFSFVSTGSFVIYPFYFYTDATDEVGIYFRDGNTITKVPVFCYKNVGRGTYNVYYANNASDKENQPGYTETDDYRNANYHSFIPAIWKNQYEMERVASWTIENDFNWVDFSAYGEYLFTSSYPTDIVRAQGIKIDIPVGTVFGMYLINGDHTFYSESSLNSAEKGSGTYTKNGVSHPYSNYDCYASTFKMGDQMYLGFEDWAYTTGNSDSDLNDIMIAFDGAAPHVVDEDPATASWVLACEDLGSTFDTDYNDVVFSVEHVSGRLTATVTPLAAGGTLASHIYYEEEDLGEIHQLLGASEATTGNYTPINVGESRGTAGIQKTIMVSEDFTMSSSEVGTITVSGNMGNFKVVTYYDVNNPGVNSVIAAPQVGKVPEMICLPLTYEIENDPEEGKKTTYTWAWSKELKTIYNTQNGAYGTGSYPEFGEWVNDYTKNTDWYKHPETSLTVSEKKVVENIGSGGGGSNNPLGPTGNQTTSGITIEPTLSSQDAIYGYHYVITVADGTFDTTKGGTIKVTYSSQPRENSYIATNTGALVSSNNVSVNNGTFSVIFTAEQLLRIKDGFWVGNYDSNQSAISSIVYTASNE